jgi:hypothetical protein
MNPGDIIKYRTMCEVEDADTLQRGMNFRLHPTHSVLLMSTRSNAPYDDEIQDDGKVLIYEGHDLPKTTGVTNPKKHDQPMFTKTGKLTQNGLFYEAAKLFQSSNRDSELVRVYEKLHSGMWVYNGQFGLIDAWQETSAGRRVFKFKLEMLDNQQLNKQVMNHDQELEHTRLIPSSVKVQVWQRDKGACVKCGSKTNLHYDHIIPYSLGGTSLSAKNIQLLCMTCNLAKRARIE